jgi:hypothetical protein
MPNQTLKRDRAIYATFLKFSAGNGGAGNRDGPSQPLIIKAKLSLKRAEIHPILRFLGPKMTV